VDAKVALFDERIRPDAGYQLFLGYQCTGIFQEYCEDLERPTAEPERLLVFQQQALSCEETKRAERRPNIGLPLIVHPASPSREASRAFYA
jgi:hypothetical protein